MNKILIAGMGKTGLSAARHLSGGAVPGPLRGGRVYAADTREHPPFAAEIKNILGESRCYAGEDFIAWPPEKLREFNYIVPSPGARLPRAWQTSAAPEIVSELWLFERAGGADGADTGRAPVLLCLTGTNGKSTVAASVAELCRACGLSAEAAGNFGEPLLDARARWAAAGAPDVAVAELSSFQLGYSSGIGSHAAAVLNVSPDHLDYHENFAEYAEAKSRIYNKASYCAVNLDDSAAAKMAARRRITFSARNESADWRLDEEYITGGGARFVLSEISPALSAENALAALALFSALQKKAPTRGADSTAAPLLSKTFPRRQAAEALARFPGLPHRRQAAGVFGGVSYINDSKSTNVAAARFALDSVKGEIILIAGGDGKGQDFSPLSAACGRIKKAFLFGKDSARLGLALRRGGAECEIVADMKSAVAGAAGAAKNGGSVLLSPACSSLDMYENYAARGEDFMREAQNAGRRQKEKRHALP